MTAQINLRPRGGGGAYVITLSLFLCVWIKNRGSFFCRYGSPVKVLLVLLFWIIWSYIMFKCISMNPNYVYAHLPRDCKIASLYAKYFPRYSPKTSFSAVWGILAAIFLGSPMTSVEPSNERNAETQKHE